MTLILHVVSFTLVLLLGSHGVDAGLLVKLKNFFRRDSPPRVPAVFKEVVEEMHTFGNLERAQKMEAEQFTRDGGHFLGVSNEEIRTIAERYCASNVVPLAPAMHLLDSPIVEERILSLNFLGHKYDVSEAKDHRKIVDQYVKFIPKRITSRNLAELGANQILAKYVLDPQVPTLYQLARSTNIWMRWSAVLSTFPATQAHMFMPLDRVASIVLNDVDMGIRKTTGLELEKAGAFDPTFITIFVAKNAKRISLETFKSAVRSVPPELKERLEALVRPRFGAKLDVEGTGHGY